MNLMDLLTSGIEFPRKLMELGVNMPPEFIISVPRIILTLSPKILYLMNTMKEPRSANWNPAYSVATRFIKAVTECLPDTPLKEVQYLSSICRNLPYPGLEIKKDYLPDSFRDEAYSFLKHHFSNKYGYYPQSKEEHWSNSKKIEFNLISTKYSNSNGGGAYTLGHSCLYNSVYTDLSKASGSKIFALDYRLGPQATLPSIIEDVVAAYFYLTAPKNQGGMGVPSSRIVVGGDSAGGGLSGNLAHILKSFGNSQVAGMFLWSPSIDLTFSQPSRYENSYKDILPNIINPPIMVGNNLKIDSSEFLFMYKQGSDKIKKRMEMDGAPLAPKEFYQLPEITPPFDPDMNGLPPTLIITGDRDAFRDSSIIYGKRRAETEKLTKNRMGTILPNVQTIIYEDLPHVFMTIPGDSRTNSAVTTTAEFIQKAMNLDNFGVLASISDTSLPDMKKSYMNNTYNMYWNSLNGITDAWESPYKVVPFPGGNNLVTTPNAFSLSN
ncbi:alpha/beta-hydrolase [Conidiobolus coronatus NRRL 28638]|uniref:Alpha/beta-hydrolase n=1 Tax=Conidiobolus coronatus (strain ATCC 28846 / CBS 209.66 / NRRL 28638) TaxID=796925 RepID=A0A137PBK0_CONC2|nr:alpha/beta-hydrolase [Conidiobolus coronatus NRRL 28638]|eukprot:KXN72387.1 alpha/beta-hydrolase [Conidiobolus coronatus NRRL 28638]